MAFSIVRGCAFSAVKLRSGTTAPARSSAGRSALQCKIQRSSVQRLGRRAQNVRCMAEPERKDTLSNLDSLLGIEPEPEKPPTPVAPPPPPPPEPKLDAKIPTPEDLSGQPDISEKVIGSVCYMLPLMDGLKYSKFILMQAPQFALLLAPLQPVIKLYYSLGFLNIVFFFAMYFGVGQNRGLSKFLRYNAMQAIVLDILLILPDVISTLFNGINGPPTGGPMLELQILFDNTVFLYVYLCAAYGSISALIGKEARLPLVSDAADQQSSR